LSRQKGAFDDVAVLVAVGVVGDRAPAARAAAFSVALLVLGFWDDRHDAAAAQLGAYRSRGVRLVGQHRLGSGPRPAATGPWHPDGVQQRQAHRRVSASTSTDEQGDGSSFAVDGVVDLGAQPAAGPPDRVVSRLGEQIPVIRAGPPVVRGRVVAC
jgi:hypothetical protein